MLQRVMIDGIELPRLYIAENRRDAEIAKNNGIPFVRWTQGQEALIKILLRPVLERMFPHIRWDAVLGRKRAFKTIVSVYEAKPKEEDQVELAEKLSDTSKGGTFNKVDLSDPDETHDDVTKKTSAKESDECETEIAISSSGERLFSGGGKMMVERKLDIADYIDDMSSYVNIDMLQRLRLMPAFIGDILDCVKINMTSGLYWREGYNKRLGIPVGRFNSSRQLPNLIILDVSGSIPRGISATMISLVDTLRTQLSADLIITGSNSRFYPMDSTLPSPDRIRGMFGYGNEATEFFAILDKHIRGKHYGHVFSFGDNDAPEYFNRKHKKMPSMGGTTIEHVHHYHTGLGCYGRCKKTGYALWCHMLSKRPAEEYDTSWCEVIRD